ncbi:MAG: anti-sigma factor [Rhodanobacter sp.]
MNNTHETDSFVSETEIHAYVDGRLGEADCRRIEAWLERHPARAKEIRGWQLDAQQLRAALGALPTARRAPALDPTAIRLRRHRRRIERLSLAAALVLTLGIGGAGGWQIRSYQATIIEAPMADAMQAYRMFAHTPGIPLDVVQNHPGQLQAWLDKHFHDPAQLPDLESAGFRAVGGRLLATASGPAALVLYENPHGSAISFYIRSPVSDMERLPRGQRRQGELAAAYWSRSGYNYALVSRANQADMHVIQLASLR